MHRVRIVAVVLASVALTSLTVSPSNAHGSWHLTVGYPQIWTGPIWGGVDGDAYFEIEPNHYRLESKMELQASVGGGPWQVIDSDTRSKIQTGFIAPEVGKTCLMPTGGVRQATYYRVRLVYLRVITQTGNLHTSYSNIYRPAGRNITYSSFCSPWPF